VIKADNAVGVRGSVSPAAKQYISFRLHMSHVILASVTSHTAHALHGHLSLLQWHLDVNWCCIRGYKAYIARPNRQHIYHIIKYQQRALQLIGPCKFYIPREASTAFHCILHAQ
jgi:hypothetical protein